MHRQQGQVLSEGRGGARHCAVWGSPIRHSLSPVLHRAAYAALGLHDWSYDRREVDAAAFAGAFAGLDETWRGLSLTMPLKEVACGGERGRRRSPRRRARPTPWSATPTGAGWNAHNTDIHGIDDGAARGRLHRPIERARHRQRGHGTLCGRALAAPRHAAGRVHGARPGPRPETLAQAGRAGLVVEVVRTGGLDPAPTSSVISTVPPTSVHGPRRVPRRRTASRARVVLDVVYGRADRRRCSGARDRGWTLADGTDMLLHQAAAQVRAHDRAAGAAGRDGHRRSLPSSTRSGAHRSATTDDLGDAFRRTAVVVRRPARHRRAARRGGAPAPARDRWLPPRRRDRTAPAGVVADRAASRWRCSGRCWPGASGHCRSGR